VADVTEVTGVIGVAEKSKAFVRQMIGVAHRIWLTRQGFGL
jgi:hypothetical protein